MKKTGGRKSRDQGRICSNNKKNKKNLYLYPWATTTVFIMNVQNLKIFRYYFLKLFCTILFGANLFLYRINFLLSSTNLNVQEN